MKRGILDNPQMREKVMCAKLGLVLNLVLSICAITSHKYLFVKFNFPNLLATMLHMTLGALYVHAAAASGSFAAVRIMWKQVFLLSVGFCTLVTFANLSLQYNTLGTFLMLKTTTLLWIPLMHLVKYKYAYSRKTLLALSPVVLGGAVHFYFDSELNLKGVVYGLISALATSVYQIHVSEKQKELQVDALQLLYYEAPISAVLTLFGAMIFEMDETVDAIINPGLPALIVCISGICWSFLNFTTYWTIGNATCTEYNVISQIKFATTLIIAYCFFDTESVDFKQILGDVMVLCGVVIYTHLKLVDTIQERINRRDRVVFPTRRV